MSVQVIGKTYLFDFGESAKYRLRFVDERNLEVTVVADSYYKPGTLNKFVTQRTQLRPDLYMATWTEPATGNTVIHVQDFENGIVYINITDLASKGFWTLKGTITEVS
jgi:hypothetical protein